MGIRWVRQPSGVTGMVEADPETYAELLALDTVIIDGQAAHVAPTQRPDPDQVWDLVVRFEAPYKPPPWRIICEDAEMARRYVAEGIIVWEGKPYVPRIGDEAHVVVLFPYVAALRVVGEGRLATHSVTEMKIAVS